MIQSISIQSMLASVDVRTGDERRKALLGVRGLRKRLGEHPDERLLLDIDRIEIATHGAYLLTGMNGAGKSTLLRVLGGLERAEIDSLRFEGLDVIPHPYPRAMRTGIVYVHQHPVLFSTSVAHNIGYGLSVRGAAPAEIAAQVEEAMAWANVAHLRDIDPARLSRGEQRRVALARAKVLRPKLMLLDEPTADLDEVARERLFGSIAALIDAGGSVLIASHDRNLVGQEGVQLMELREGRLEIS
nr:energy-coupling factor ABC transporter ATP-binding protein [uncultured Massilia sp.]